LNLTLPLELAPYIENDFQHQNVCQLAFDQFVQLTQGVGFIEKTLLVSVAGIGLLYLITLWRIRNIELMLLRVKEVRVDDVKEESVEPTTANAPTTSHPGEPTQEPPSQEQEEGPRAPLP
jgi:hypothetical protein